MPIARKEYLKIVREIRNLVPNIKIVSDDDIVEGDNGCYCETDNTIYIRSLDRYRSVKMCRHVLFHELSHWAAKSGRGGRVKKFATGNKVLDRHNNYALEEIIVDKVAFSLCLELKSAIDKRNHQKYVNRFVKYLTILDADIEHYIENKCKSLKSFIKNYKKNLT